MGAVGRLLGQMDTASRRCGHRRRCITSNHTPSTIRFVDVKSEDQQVPAMLFGARQRFVFQSTQMYPEVGGFDQI